MNELNNLKEAVARIRGASAVIIEALKANANSVPAADVQLAADALNSVSADLTAAVAPPVVTPPVV